MGKTDIGIPRDDDERVDCTLLTVYPYRIGYIERGLFFFRPQKGVGLITFFHNHNQDQGTPSFHTALRDSPGGREGESGLTLIKGIRAQAL